MGGYNEKSKAYSLQYARSKLKRVPLDLKISDYDRLQEAAQAAGESVNGYIKKAIFEAMERDAASNES